MSDLKPCPFCGSNATWKKTTRGWAVQCSQRWGICRMNSRTHYQPHKEQAVIAWNIRADTIEAQAAEIERLRAAQEWQPIETAPRVDDFTCLVAGRSRSGDWFMDVACWQADDEGWWPNTLNSVGYQLNFSFWTPEVWIPLPEPPRAALGEKD